MPKINVLDKSVFELIAAGEVIERPASVIKELVENSIDAGAKHITVEIKNGGASFMRVSDDGCGIAFDDIPKAFLRHATSKVKSASDLDSIFTLGFRGEALASVAAVARVEIMTKEPGEQMGGCMTISGGETVEYERAGCPDGTTVIIRDLFFNVPARRKFLKKDVTEGNQVQSLTDKLALAHPDISFRFIRDGRQVRDTGGGGDYYSAIYAVFGKQFALSLIPVDFTLGGIEVSGYVSSPLFSKANRALQYFFVNGRNVKSVICMTALEEGFRNSIMTGKFPACVLNINLAPSLCDVNVSPSKTEVRFADEKTVFDAVCFGVRNAVLNADNSREVRLEKKAIPSAPEEKSLFEKASEVLRAAPVGGREPPETPPEPVLPVKEKKLYFNSPITPLKTSDGFSPYVQTHFSPKDVRIEYDEYPEEEKKPAESAFSAAPAVKKPEAPEPSEIRDKPPERPDNAPEGREIPPEAVRKAVTPAPAAAGGEEKPRLKLVGEVFGTYIVCEYGGEMLLIDKHAAHERIRFEQRKKELTTSAQLLAQSEFVTLDEERYAALETHKGLLEDIGLEIILSGGNRAEITASPSAFVGSRSLTPSEILLRCADCLMNGSENITDEIYGDLQHSRACKSAIRAHDKNSPEELYALAERVINDPGIRFCPHGRPIMLKLSEYELEKYFSRVV